MITTPGIICELFSFLDKDQIERIQLVNQFWNNVIVCHKNILPLRLFADLDFSSNRIHLYATKGDLVGYIIKFDGTNLSKFKGRVSLRYSQLTIDEVLTNLNDVVFDTIKIKDYNITDDLLNLMRLFTAKIGGRVCGRFGWCEVGRFFSTLNEIVDNYIIVDEFVLDEIDLCDDSYIREVCANPEFKQLPSTPKEIRLRYLRFKENDEVLNFTCNGKLNGANRLTIVFNTPDTNYGNFIRQWFELYRTHQNPISLVGKFEPLTVYKCDIVLDAVKKFLNKNQLRVKYSLEAKEFHRFLHSTNHLKRSCVLHETNSYALVIEMEYGLVTDVSSINASDLDQPSCNQMRRISFCVKSLLF